MKKLFSGHNLYWNVWNPPKTYNVWLHYKENPILISHMIVNVMTKWKSVNEIGKQSNNALIIQEGEWGSTNVSSLCLEKNLHLIHMLCLLVQLKNQSIS